MDLLIENARLRDEIRMLRLQLQLASRRADRLQDRYRDTADPDDYLIELRALVAEETYLASLAREQAS